MGSGTGVLSADPGSGAGLTSSGAGLTSSGAGLTSADPGSGAGLTSAEPGVLSAVPGFTKNPVKFSKNDDGFSAVSNCLFIFNFNI